jgi:HMG-box domain
MQLSARWKNLSEDEKSVYFEKERLDRERFNEEAAEADQMQLEIQEERRKKVGLDEADLEDGQKRGARQRQDETREERERQKKQRKLEIEAEMDPEILEERRRAREQKKRETEERQKARAEKENAMAQQHAKLDKEQAKKATNRLEYLLKQSSIFGKLKMGGNAPKEDKKPDKKDSKNPEVHHRPVNEDEEAVDSEVEDDKESHVFLTKQPSTIKFGQLKPYQLESLNWMIHLAEKGLNGILAGKLWIRLAVFDRLTLQHKWRTPLIRHCWIRYLNMLVVPLLSIME